MKPRATIRMVIERVLVWRRKGALPIEAKAVAPESVLRALLARAP